MPRYCSPGEAPSLLTSHMLLALIRTRKGRTNVPANRWCSGSPCCSACCGTGGPCPSRTSRTACPSDPAARFLVSPWQTRPKPSRASSAWCRCSWWRSCCRCSSSPVSGCGRGRSPGGHEWCPDRWPAQPTLGRVSTRPWLPSAWRGVLTSTSLSCGMLRPVGGDRGVSARAFFELITRKQRPGQDLHSIEVGLAEPARARSLRDRESVEPVMALRPSRPGRAPGPPREGCLGGRCRCPAGTVLRE